MKYEHLYEVEQVEIHSQGHKRGQVHIPITLGDTAGVWVL